MTVEELLDRISAAELTEWMAYYAYEPFGESWKQTSYLCSMIGNGSGGKRGGGAFKPVDFLPVKPPKPAPMTGDQILSVFRMLASKPCQQLPL